LDKKLPVALAATAQAVTLGGEAGARGTLVNIRLTNRGKSEVIGVAAFAPSAMRSIEGGTWPDASLSKPLASYYIGYRQAIGPDRKRPLHENAALLLFDGPGRKLNALVANSAGYNFGLVGISCPIAIKPGEAIALPLLFVAADAPEKGPAFDLGASLDAARDRLLAKPAPP
jgi:hypothetical protein